MLKKRRRIGLTHHRSSPKIQQGTSSEQESIFERLFEAAPDAAVVVDANGSIGAVNELAETLFGYPRSEMIGQPIELLVPEKHRLRHISLRTRYMSRPYRRETASSSGREYQGRAGFLRLELAGRRKDGSTFPAEITLNPIALNGGRVVLAVVRDITPRVAAEANLRTQAELIRLLQDVAIASNEAETIQSAAQFAIDRLCAYLGWPVGHALLVESGVLVLSMKIWKKDLPDRYSIFRAVSEALHYKAGFGLPGSVLASGQPVWMTDLADNPQFPRSREAKAVGLHTGLAMPVLVGKQVAGVLEFFHEEKIPTDVRLIAVLPHIGVQLGRVIERKQAEEALRKSAAQVRMVMNNLPVILWVIDREGQIILLEGKGVAASGLNPQDMLGKNIFSILDRRPDLLLEIRRALEGQEIHTEVVSESGAVFETYYTPYYDENWAVDGVIGLSFDITERKRMESELEEMQDRLMESAETERSRLGQQIHDGPLQDLYGAFYQVQEVKGLLDEEGQVTAGRALSTIQQVNATLRMIVGELRPSTLVHLGLNRAIQSHVERLEEVVKDSKFHLDLDQDAIIPGGSEPSVPHNLRLVLFRVYQQAVANAIRHSGARHIWVRLRMSESQAVLEVQDTGRGFTVPEHWIEMVRQGRIGLASALERVQAVGGTMEVRSKPGSGTLVRVTIPLEQEKPA